jgi:hypothetical protein
MYVQCANVWQKVHIEIWHVLKGKRWSTLGHWASIHWKKPIFVSLFVPSYNGYTADMVLSASQNFNVVNILPSSTWKVIRVAKNQTSGKCSPIKAVWYASQDDFIPAKSHYIQQYLCSIKVLFVSSIAQNIQNSCTNHVIHLLARLFVAHHDLHVDWKNQHWLCMILFLNTKQERRKPATAFAWFY